MDTYPIYFEDCTSTPRRLELFIDLASWSGF
jgi:hypothetical protein